VIWANRGLATPRYSLTTRPRWAATLREPTATASAFRVGSLSIPGDSPDLVTSSGLQDCRSILHPPGHKLAVIGKTGFIYETYEKRNKFKREVRLLMLSTKPLLPARQRLDGMEVAFRGGRRAIDQFDFIAEILWSVVAVKAVYYVVARKGFYGPG
jgi:hypothetical protein